MTYSVKAQYLNRGSRVSQSNGKTYYTIAIMQGTEPAQLGCSLEVYNLLEGAEPMEEMNFLFTEAVRSGVTGSFVSRYCTGVENI